MADEIQVNQVVGQYEWTPENGIQVNQVVAQYESQEEPTITINQVVAQYEYITYATGGSPTGGEEGMRVITLQSVTSALDMFDEFTDTQTEVAEAISETFTTDGCNAVVILNTYGITATLMVTDLALGEVYYNETVSLIRDSIKDWWDYFFAPCRTGRDLVFYFEGRASTQATITISYPGGTAKCGLCKPGVATVCGKTKYGVDVGITDYSIVDTDSFGSSYLSVGAWAKRADANIIIATSSLDLVQRKMIENRGVPAVYDFNNYKGTILDSGHTSLDGLQCLIVYGYFERFVPEIQHPVSTEYGLEVQGLI